MKILDRYLLTEMLWPFVGGLLTFMVLISGHMLFLAIETLVDHRVPLWGVLQYVAYQLPGATIMALPVATLLAASLALNRLARDHEITAIRTGGASPARLLLPAAGLGALAALISIWLSGTAAPASTRAAATLLRNVVLQQKALVFRPHQFFDTGRGISLYVEGVDHRRDTVQGLHAFLLRPDAPPVLLWAPEAIFGATTLEAPTTRTYALDPSGALSWGNSGLASIDLTRIGQMSAPARSGGLQDMSLAELRLAQQRTRAYDPEGGRRYALEIQSRLAMACACIVFAFVAGPVTWRFGRGQNLVGVLATILVVFVFYVLMLWTRMLGLRGFLPPVVAAWAQDVVFLAGGLIAIFRQR
jgi:lipopolysaccharide export system permease protein